MTLIRPLALAAALVTASLGHAMGSREDVLAAALTSSPAVLAARERVEAAGGRVDQAGLYPNPELEAEQSDLRLGNGRAMSSVGISQEILTSGRRGAGIALAKTEAARAEREAATTIRTVLAEADLLYTTILYHNDDLASQFDLLDEAEKTVLAAESRTTPRPQDVARARIERDRLVLEVTRHSAERFYTIQQLQELLGGATLRPDLFTGELDQRLVPNTMPLDWIESHPELQAADLATVTEDRRKALIRRERLPDVTVSVGAAHDDEMDDTAPWVGLKIPIPLWDRRQGDLKAVDHDRAAAANDREQVRLRLERELAESDQQINEFDTFVQEYRENVVPSAMAALESARKEYEAGSIDFDDLLDSQRVYTEARDTWFQYLLALNEVLARRRALAGYSVERGR